MSLSVPVTQKIQEILNVKPIITRPVKAYVSQDYKWKYTGIIGMLCVVSNADQSVYHLKLINGSTAAVVWEQEIYNKFECPMLNQVTACVQTDSQIIAFLFTEKNDANSFNSGMNLILSKFSSDTEDLKQKKKSEAAVQTKPKKHKKKKNLLSKIFKDNSSKKNFVLSDPTKFRHESHIGWDPESGFKLSNIPAEWKKLFQMANIKKKELEDAETAQFVMNVVVDALSGMTDNAPQIKSTHDTQTTTTTTSQTRPVNSNEPTRHAPPATVPSPRQPTQQIIDPILDTSFAPVTSTPPPAPPPPTDIKQPAYDRESLLFEIQSGTKLKSTSVDSNPMSMPDITNLDSDKANDLASILSKAMFVRRQDINYVEDNNDAESYSKDDLSDWDS